MSFRMFAAIVGGIAVIAGLVVLWLPIEFDNPNVSGERVSCGDAFKVDTSSVETTDMAHAIMYPNSTDKTLAERCQDQATQHRFFGWPLVAVGGVVLAGAIVIRKGYPVRGMP